MLEELLEILKNSKADDFEVTQLKTVGWEFYFIGHSLDQNRARKTEHINVKVFKRTEDSLGIAEGELPADSSYEEIQNFVDDLITQASLVKNKPYELPEPQETEAIAAAIPDRKEEAAKLIDIFNTVHETETEYLNSYEIFSDVTERRFINSRGIDVTETYPSTALEVVVNAKNDEHEIELYRYYQKGACDEQQTRKEIEDTLRFGKDRLKAEATPKLNEYPILLSTDAALQVYRWFLDGLNTGNIYRRISSFAIGKEIAEGVNGDKVTLEAKRNLPYSGKNFICDSEGSVIRDTVLMKDNVPLAFQGPRMFSQYLGLEDTFQVSNVVVSGGTKSEAELRSGKYLEIVEFSDFQIDSINGDIFGEIRLAYYHDGEKTVPVTGGSVSGDLKEALKDMYMSVNTRQYGSYVIPSVTRLEKVTVAGVK